MSKEMKSALWRFMRVAISIIIAGIAAKYGNDPYYLALAPFLTGFSKYARDKWGIDVLIV